MRGFFLWECLLAVAVLSAAAVLALLGAQVALSASRSRESVASCVYCSSALARAVGAGDFSGVFISEEEPGLLRLVASCQSRGEVFSLETLLSAGAPSP